MKEYGNTYDLEFLFEGIEDTYFVHPQYVELAIEEIKKNNNDKTKQKEVVEKVKKEWKEFFIKLGVETKPRIEINSNGRINDTKYSSSTLTYIIEKGDNKKKDILIKILDSNWSYYKKFTTNTTSYLPYGDRRYNRQQKKENSEWFEKITNSTWLPAKDGISKKPSELFLDKPEIRKTLGDSVHYLNAEIKNEEFIEALSINATVTVEAVINLLKDLVAENCTDESRFSKFYSFLDMNFEDNKAEIRKCFKENELIFISDKYISSEKALWKDVSKVFEDYYCYLEKYYPDLKDFFIDKLKISEKPESKHYADILVQLSKKDEIEKKDETKIPDIYKELNKFLKSDKSILNENWWKDFVGKGIFWTNKSIFWTNDDDVFVNDNDELFEIFKDKEEIAFLNIKADKIQEFDYFIKETGLEYLSQKATKEILGSIDSGNLEKLTKQIKEITIYIVRYLYKEEDKVYKSSKEDGRLLQLLNLICLGVDTLNIKYSIGDIFAIKDDEAILDGNNLFIKIDALNQKDELDDDSLVSMELAKLFGSPKGLSSFIRTMFLIKSIEKRESSLKDERIPQLPQDELEWLEKHFAKISEIELSSDNTDIVEDFEIEETHDIDLIVENDEQISDDLSENYAQDNSYQKNQKTELSRTEPKSQSSLNQAKTQSTKQPKQNLLSKIQKENLQKNDWEPDVDPFEVEIRISKPIFDINPSNINRSQNTQSDLKNLSSDKKKSETNNDTLTQEAKRKIGLTGEKHAIKALQDEFLSKYKGSEIKETLTGFDVLVNNRIIVKVNWLNKNGDSGVGHDISFIENDEEHFIEVKSTITDSKEIMQISEAQWQFAKEKQERFSILRVYNAGTHQARLVRFCNPYKLWQEEHLTIQSLWIRI